MYIAETGLTLSERERLLDNVRSHIATTTTAATATDNSKHTVDSGGNGGGHGILTE